MGSIMIPLPNLQNAVEPYPYDPEAPVGASANVVEKYRASVVENVRLDLDVRRSALINVCVNTGSDFNLSSVIRSGNAFGVRATVVAGRRRYDRRGTVGTHHYEHVVHGPDVLAIIEALIEDQYTVIPVDNTPEYSPRSIYDVVLPERTAFLYGEEGDGLAPDVVAACNGAPTFIPQGGSVRSLNVASAASIFMYEYARQHRLPWQE